MLAILRKSLKYPLALFVFIGIMVCVSQSYNPSPMPSVTTTPNSASAPSSIAEAEIVVYTNEHCDFCIKLADLLDKKGVSYKKIEVTTTQQVKELEEKCGKRTVPQIFINGVHKGSYTEMFVADMFGKLTEILKGN